MKDTWLYLQDFDINRRNNVLKYGLLRVEVALLITKVGIAFTYNDCPVSRYYIPLKQYSLERLGERIQEFFDSEKFDDCVRATGDCGFADIKGEYHKLTKPKNLTYEGKYKSHNKMVGLSRSQFNRLMNAPNA